jgi:galactose mutarotase-like enzyme
VLGRKSGRKIAFETKSSVVAFWADDDKGQYVCVEPWWGVPDDADVKREISEKTLMESVEVGETFTTDYVIEIL